MTAAPIDSGFEDSMCPLSASHAVDCPVWVSVIVPKAAFNVVVCWVMADDESKCAYNDSAIGDNETVAVFNVVGN